MNRAYLATLRSRQLEDDQDTPQLTEWDSTGPKQTDAAGRTWPGLRVALGRTRGEQTTKPTQHTQRVRLSWRGAAFTEHRYAACNEGRLAAD